MTRVALRLARNEPVAYADDLVRVGGVLLAAAAHRPAGEGRPRPGGRPARTSGVWTLLAAVVGIEAVRWTWLVAIAVQWHGCWVGWQTVPRVNLLRSLVDDPGPGRGPAARRARRGGQPLPRRRPGRGHGARRLARPVGRRGVRHGRGARRAGRDRPGRRRSPWPCRWCIAIAGHLLAGPPPAGVAARGARGHRPGDRVHRRHVRRACWPSSPAGPSAAVRRRFAQLNAQRARVGRRDQVGSELVRSLGYGTGEVAAGVALVVVASHVPPAATCRSATSACSRPTRR